MAGGGVEQGWQQQSQIREYSGFSLSDLPDRETFSSDFPRYEFGFSLTRGRPHRP